MQNLTSKKIINLIPFGLIFTGVILLMATFSLPEFYPLRVSTSFSVKFGEAEFWTPAFNGKSFLLLLLYLALNLRYFTQTYLHYKYPQQEDPHS